MYVGNHETPSIMAREPQAIAGRATLYLTTSKKKLHRHLSCCRNLLPGLNLHRSEVFHGATRTVETVCYCQVFSL